MTRAYKNKAFIEEIKSKEKEKEKKVLLVINTAKNFIQEDIPMYNAGTIVKEI